MTPRRARTTVVWLAVVTLLAGVGVGVMALTAGHSSHHRGPLRPAIHPGQAAKLEARSDAQISVDTAGPTRRVPRSFLGVSTEYWTLPVDERHIRLYGRVLSLIHVPGDGRMVLRIGGDSSDHALFDVDGRDLTNWVFRITPGWISRTARVIRENHLRVIIDLNLITGTPHLAALWVSEAEREFPAGSIIGLEVGNEPDLYDRAFWVARIGMADFGLGSLPDSITPAGYARRYLAYERALAAVAPGIPLLAPALANPRRHLDWIAVLLHHPHPGLREISIHEYPYSDCARPGAAAFPTVAKLLSRHATAVMYGAIAPAVRLAGRGGFPVRVTEFNSVTCGGVEGVSNTFATALWAPGALFEMVRAGVIAAELHVRVFSINPPFIFTEHGIRARPLLYGLIMFARMLGRDARTTRVWVRAPQRVNLDGWAVRVGPRRLNVLLINKSARSLRVAVHLPSAQLVSVQRLLAHSPHATRGVTLDGQHLDDRVRWRGRRRVETVAGRSGTYAIDLPRYSAALLSTNLARP